MSRIWGLSPGLEVPPSVTVVTPSDRKLDFPNSTKIQTRQNRDLTIGKRKESGKIASSTESNSTCEETRTRGVWNAYSQHTLQGHFNNFNSRNLRFLILCRRWHSRNCTLLTPLSKYTFHLSKTLTSYQSAFFHGRQGVLTPCRSKSTPIDELWGRYPSIPRTPTLDSEFT